MITLRHQANSDLQPLFPVCVTSIIESVGKGLDLRTIHGFNSTVTAGIIQNLIVNNLTHESATIPGFFPVVVNKMSAFRFGTYLLRVKKFDSALCTANIPTNQTKRFENQLELAEGMGKLTLLNLGYQLDSLETSVTGAFITYTRGSGKPKWYLELPLNMATINHEIIPDDPYLDDSLLIKPKETDATGTV